MKVKFKKLDPNASIPKYAKHGDAAVDLVAIYKEWSQEKGTYTYGTGLAFEIPEGHVGLIFPRSSICKVALSLSNSVGVIDSGYRGEVKFVFRFTDLGADVYEVGDKVGQLIIMPYPTIELEEANELSTTERGSGGFGSSGR